MALERRPESAHLPDLTCPWCLFEYRPYRGLVNMADPDNPPEVFPEPSDGDIAFCPECASPGIFDHDVIEERSLADDEPQLIPGRVFLRAPSEHEVQEIGRLVLRHNGVPEDRLHLYDVAALFGTFIPDPQEEPHV